jgi:hypothetical protein
LTFEFELPLWAVVGCTFVLYRTGFAGILNFEQLFRVTPIIATQLSIFSSVFHALKITPRKATVV